MSMELTFEVKYMKLFGKFIAKFGGTYKRENIFHEFWYLYIYQFICSILFVY